MVESRQFKSISEVVQEGIRLVEMQTRGDLDMLHDEDFDRKVMASLARIERGEAVMRTPKQVETRIREARQKKLQQS